MVRGSRVEPGARLLIVLVTAVAIGLWAAAPPAGLLGVVFVGAVAICWTQRRDELVSVL